MEPNIEAKGYTGANIKVLKGLEAVRKRPGMYIGNTGVEGLHHLIWEVVDNSVDEAAAGYGDKVIIERRSDNSITTTDFGRGIPVDIHPTEGISTLEVIFTVLHAGGKFDADTYKTSGGLHGVGASVTNALSESLTVEVCRDNQIHRMRFAKGDTVEPLSVVGKCTKTGTKVSFKPDPEIFKNPYVLDGVEYDGTTFIDEMIMARVQELAFLNKGLEMVFVSNEEHVFKYDDGLVAFVKDVTKNPLFEPIMFEGNDLGVEVGVAIAYSSNYDTIIKGFVNNIYTKEGGSHEIGSMLAINAALMQHMTNKGFKKTDTIKAEDIKEGLTCIVSVRVVNPEFEGQTKGKLNDSNTRKATYKIVKDKFSIWLEENPKEYEKILQKILLAQKAREASKKSRETVRKSETEKGLGVLPSKLADCSSSNADICELVLVEGASAAGCFVSNTLIKLADGTSDTIENLSKRFDQGEDLFVYTYNHTTDKIEIQKIANCWKTKRTNDLIKVTLDNNEEIVSTSDHKFLLRDGSYVEAKDLTEDLALCNFPELVHKVLKIESYSKMEDVYDIEVPGTHNFALDAGVFVHNSAKQGRNRATQAVLALKGKVINVFKNDMAKCLKNEEIYNIIIALGCGYGKNIDISKIRYKKIIIMTDADVDGEHIAFLLILMFYKLFRPLIDAGYLYLAIPPLYRVSKGEKVGYFDNYDEIDAFARAGVKDKKQSRDDLLKSWTITRFKGLGEMDPEQLSETTMNPGTRKIVQITIPKDEEDSTKKLLALLGGDDSKFRKTFLMSYTDRADVVV
jgi:DNA gyrase subunit B